MFREGSRVRSLWASWGRGRGLRWRWRRCGSSGSGSGRFAGNDVGLLQFADGLVDGRTGRFLAQRVDFAAFDAASAEGALAGVVGPSEFTLASLVGDGARGATEFADGTAGAERGIELHETTEALGHFGAQREAHGA